jgi:hypothetical protein
LVALGTFLLWNGQQYWGGKPPETLSLGKAVVGYRFRTTAADLAIVVVWQDQEH